MSKNFKKFQKISKNFKKNFKKFQKFQKISKKFQKNFKKFSKNFQKIFKKFSKNFKKFYRNVGLVDRKDFDIFFFNFFISSCSSPVGRRQDALVTWLLTRRFVFMDLLSRQRNCQNIKRVPPESGWLAVIFGGKKKKSKNNSKSSTHVPASMLADENFFSRNSADRWMRKSATELNLLTGTGESTKRNLDEIGQRMTFGLASLINWLPWQPREQVKHPVGASQRQLISNRKGGSSDMRCRHATVLLLTGGNCCVGHRKNCVPFMHGLARLWPNGASTKAGNPSTPSSRLLHVPFSHAKWHD